MSILCVPTPEKKNKYARNECRVEIFPFLVNGDYAVVVVGVVVVVMVMVL